MKENKSRIMTFLSVILLFLSSCGQENIEEKSQNKSQKNAKISQDTLFPNGVKVPNDNFVGDVYLTMLSTDPTGEFNAQTYNVEFKAGSRTNWHSHPGGQILIATSGVGYYQEEGGPIKQVHVGETIECPKDIPHWHGASPHSDFSHIGITTNVDAGAPDWGEPVSDEEYHAYDETFAHPENSTSEFSFQHLDQTQQNISEISSYTAIGNLSLLEESIEKSLDEGMTINQIKEIMLHTYAYVGFPRSLNALGTLQSVVEKRQQAGKVDEVGEDPNEIGSQIDTFQAGAEVQTQLVGMSFNYEFMPAMDEFLKKHLFADLFLRGVLSYQQRELVTIAALTTLDGVESQLSSHIRMGLNTGLTLEEIEEAIAYVGDNLDIDKSNVINEFK